MEAMTQPESGPARGKTEDQFTRNCGKVYGRSTLIRLPCRCDRRNGTFLAVSSDRPRKVGFIAQWAPTWLILGRNNKLVKLEGHDHSDRGGP